MLQCDRKDRVAHKRGSFPVQLPCINIYFVHRYSIVVSRCLTSPRMSHPEILNVVIIGESEVSLILGDKVRPYGFVSGNHLQLGSWHQYFMRGNLSLLTKIRLSKLLKFWPRVIT